ncbi:MAG: XRE family transcriptional regulator [Alphaproteobacteria bacterium PRO2]|nr:XRE family transcriptional regulator [Alphaproteobacteria bacterium PRO2]
MDSQWLKTQFAANPDKSKAGLAAAIGLEPPAISKILNGTRQIKAQEYLQMREYFGLPVDGHGATRKTYTVKAQEGFDDGSPPPAEWAIPSVISSHAAGPNKANRVFQVRESFMEPEFKRGEHVLVDISDRKPSPPGAFIISDGFNNMLRYCEYTPKSGETEIRISARKDGFQPQILKPGDFIIIGRIIAKLQMI